MAPPLLRASVEVYARSAAPSAIALELLELLDVADNDEEAAGQSQASHKRKRVR